MFVEGADHLLELARRATGALVGGVVAVGREEADGLVPPEVGGSVGVAVLVGVGLMDGKQFDAGEAECFQVRGKVGGTGIGAAQRLGHVLDFAEQLLASQQIAEPAGRGMHGEVLDVRLVDHHILRFTYRVIAGGRLVVDHHSLRGIPRRIDRSAHLAPVVAAPGREDAHVCTGRLDRRAERNVTDLTGVGIQQDLVRVEVVALLVPVGDEASHRARPPIGIDLPVAAPTAVGVIGTRADTDELGPPSAVLRLDRVESVAGVRTQRFGVDLQDHAGRGGGEDRE